MMSGSTSDQNLQDRALGSASLLKVRASVSAESGGWLAMEQNAGS